MPPRRETPLDRLAERRVLRFWTAAADGAEESDLGALRALRGRARRLRRELDRLIVKADARTALPAVGSNAMRSPLGTDWSWRPDYWRWPVEPRGRAGVASGTQLGGEVSVFHDCPLREATVRQERNRRDDDLAPFALTLDVLEFAGSFLSLAIDLPHSAAVGLKRRHLLRASLVVEAERPTGLTLRLNVRHGPNTEQIRADVGGYGEAAADFDLAGSQINEKRVEKMWLDVLLHDPRLNAVRLRDLTLSRRPRAEV